MIAVPSEFKITIEFALRLFVAIVVLKLLGSELTENTITIVVGFVTVSTVGSIVREASQ